MAKGISREVKVSIYPQDAWLLEIETILISCLMEKEVYLRA